MFLTVLSYVKKTEKVAIVCENGTFQLPFRTLSPLFCHFHPILGIFPTPSFSFALSREAEGLRQRKVGIIRADHINSGGDKREKVYLPDGCRYTSSIDERRLLLHSDKIVVFLAALYEEVVAVDELMRANQ